MSTSAQLIHLPEGYGLDDVPIERLTGRWWRQNDPKYGALSLPDRAGSGGRCHRKREEPRLYASSTEAASWGELFRHTLGEVSPYEMRRTMSELEVIDLPVVNFEDPFVRQLFNVGEAALTSNEYAACRKLADVLCARRDRFGGMILPSAAAPGERTLVVFAGSVQTHVRVVHQTTGTAPVRLLPLFREIAGTLPRPLRSIARAFIRELERDIANAAKAWLKEH